VALPEPTRGLVIRYAFVWQYEHQQGATQGSKNRPCLIVGRQPKPSGGMLVTVVPITHSPPREVGNNYVRLTPEDCQAIGLDDDPQWIVLDEMNRFTWPGSSLRFVPGTTKYEHGPLGEATFKAAVQGLVDIVTARKAAGLPGIVPVERD
jgi:hypothetical protein